MTAFSKSVAFALAIKRTGINAEHSGGLLYRRRTRQNAANMHGFELVERDVRTHLHARLP